MQKSNELSQARAKVKNLNEMNQTKKILDQVQLDKHTSQAL